MLSAGLMEIPPESKGQAFADYTIGRASGSGLPLYSITDIRDSLRDPLADGQIRQHAQLFHLLFADDTGTEHGELLSAS